MFISGRSLSRGLVTNSQSSGKGWMGDERRRTRRAAVGIADGVPAHHHPSTNDHKPSETCGCVKLHHQLVRRRPGLSSHAGQPSPRHPRPAPHRQQLRALRQPPLDQPQQQIVPPLRADSVGEGRCAGRWNPPAHRPRNTDEGNGVTVRFAPRLAPTRESSGSHSLSSPSRRPPRCRPRYPGSRRRRGHQRRPHWRRRPRLPRRPPSQPAHLPPP